MLIGILEAANLFLGVGEKDAIEIESKYPMVKALSQKIRSLPGVKNYIATRKVYTV